MGEPPRNIRNMEEDLGKRVCGPKAQHSPEPAKKKVKGKGEKGPIKSPELFFWSRTCFVPRGANRPGLVNVGPISYTCAKLGIADGMGRVLRA